MKLSQIFYNVRGFLRFYVHAITRYNIQSPFIHRFVEEVFDTKKEYYHFLDIEKERKKLLKDAEKINRIDFGAGSVYGNKTLQTPIKNIAKHSLSKPEQCRTLFNIVLFKKASTILETGTSLGISTAYLASANAKSKVYTLEGNPEIAHRAKKVFDALDLKNIQLVTGNFAITLPLVLTDIDSLDLVFLDGHHDQQATIDYFHQIIPKCGHDAIVVIDDIYWSKGMNNAWKKIKAHEKVTLTIDVFTMGIVFFNPSLSKENISFIHYWYKPWKIGLFGQ